MIKALQIPDVVFQHVNETFQALLPEEGCGFLLGKNGAVTEFQPIENVLHSPVAYRMSPADQIHTLLDAEDRHLDVLAIIHSHPNGPSQLSATDLRELAGTTSLMSLFLLSMLSPNGERGFFRPMPLTNMKKYS